MKSPKAINKLISFILSLYLLGFFLYNILPFSYFDTYFEPKDRLAPKPFVRKNYYLLGVKANFLPDERMLSFFESKNINVIYGFFPFEDKVIFKNLPKAPECNLVFTSDINPLIKFFNFIFDYLPKKSLGEEFDSYVNFISTDKIRCNVLVSDVNLSRALIDFEIDTSRNMTYRRFYEGIELNKNVIINGEKSVDVYGFSPRSFYFPDESTIYPFKLFIRSNEEKVLIILYRNGEVYRVYDTDRAVIKVNREGVYAVEVYKYKFSWKSYFFGLRLIAFSSPITLLY
ncbi:hypothetical protein JCM9492_11520 [Aquifex pyrophilus]